MFTQIFQWGGLGFLVESQVTKKGLCPLTFLSMAIFHANVVPLASQVSFQKLGLVAKFIVAFGHSTLCICCSN
jgi:hypothetical protein